MLDLNTLNPAVLYRGIGKYIGTANLVDTGLEVGFFVLWDTGHVEVSLDYATDFEKLRLSLDQKRAHHPCDLFSVFDPHSPKATQATLLEIARGLGSHGSKLFVSLRDQNSACWEVQVECD